MLQPIHTNAMLYSVETENLSYRFPRGVGSSVLPFPPSASAPQILHNVNLRVPEGSIYGFLGQNGAGKTTTLRLILGLLTKQQGIIRVLGKSFEENRIAGLREIGSLIESPSLYSHLTASENLTIYQKIHGVPKGRIAEVLDLVGLARTGTKKAAEFSLGMKQRLGLAIALLHKPSLLILDEPTNGLDPNGIIEMRELLKQLQREQGITILISSHLLSEIEKLVTHVGIIHGGKLLFQGTLEELLQKREKSSQIILETSDARRTMSVLEQFHITGRVESSSVILPFLERETIANIARELVREDISLYGIRAQNDDLETIFMNLVKD